ncbi:MAG TPA: hypothetical protein VGN26_17565 [Armatimonadota bacterium]
MGSEPRFTGIEPRSPAIHRRANGRLQRTSSANVNLDPRSIRAASSLAVHRRAYCRAVNHPIH